jgi:hypothetical protein
LVVWGARGKTARHAAMNNVFAMRDGMDRRGWWGGRWRGETSLLLGRGLLLGNSADMARFLSGVFENMKSELTERSWSTLCLTKIELLLSIWFCMQRGGFSSPKSHGHGLVLCLVD